MARDPQHPARRLPGWNVAALIASLLLLLVCMAPHAASAQSCTVTGPTLLLGTVNPYSTASTSTSGTATYSCTNPTAGALTGIACVSIGIGTGGTSATNRTLLSGSSTIPIQITAGGSSSQIGNGTSYAMYGPIAISVPANSSSGGTFPLAVTMPPPSAPPPGTYSSSFAGTDAEFIYYSGSPTMTCAALSAGTHLTAQANFTVSATIPTQCKVAATGLAFPTASVLTQPVNATATISTTCNAAVPVTVALDNGATGTGPTARKMKSGANAITYGIYRDAAASLAWGNTTGFTASLSSGTGTLTAFGRVPAQISPAPGSYADVVNVIITY